VAIVVEIRSNPHRTRDLQIRLPKLFLSLEPRIKKTIAGSTQRGRIEVYIHRNPIRSGQEIDTNLDLVDKYYQAMSLVAKRLQREPSEISLQEVFNQPGILVLKEPTPDPLQEWTILSTALDVALNDLRKQRQEEGAVLEEKLIPHRSEIQRLQQVLVAQQDRINQQLFQRLEKRLQRLLGDQLDSKRLIQEAAILVEKSDCSEELHRIEGLCLSLEEVSTSDKPLGRKLDFILQELNREINTIGSKIQDHSFAQIVIALKVQLDKLREIVTHIE
jgi:uncharacterized protein (TIGR00255 family)